jgi:hypothetical protein
MLNRVVNQFMLLEEGMEAELGSVPISLEALLATIPSDFTYPDDVADFMTNDPQGQEIL